MTSTSWRHPFDEARFVVGATVLAVIMIRGCPCEKEKPMPETMPETKIEDVVESVKRLDPQKGDALLVKISVELTAEQQARTALELRAVFPGVRIFLAGPSADIEVVRHKLATEWQSKGAS